MGQGKIAKLSAPLGLKDDWQWAGHITKGFITSEQSQKQSRYVMGHRTPD